jgi:uncharacterized protein (TIGR02270 family)
MTRVIPEIVSQHAEEAAFLWGLRADAVHAPHYLLVDLARLEERIEAHIDGLRVNGEAGWDAIRAAATGDPGAAFCAAVLAVEAGDADRIAGVVEAAVANPNTARGLVSALGWCPYERVRALVQKLIGSEDAAVKRVGIAAAAVHRQNPGPALNRVFLGAEPLLMARACRAVGELGAADAAPGAARQLREADPVTRFWAAWSGAIVSRDPAAVAALQRVAEEGGGFADEAARVAVRRLDAPRAAAWRRQLAAKSEGVRPAIAAAGALGDPEAVPWLIAQMANPGAARRAGEAFSFITGVHIAYDKLERPKPADFEAGPNDDPADPNVEMDVDDNLAWPDAALVTKWWADNAGRFATGTRYLVGKPITGAAMNEVLRTGYQRQRAAAAVELAMLQAGQPLFEVRAPAARQRRLLAV